MQQHTMCRQASSDDEDDGQVSSASTDEENIVSESSVPAVEETHISTDKREKLKCADDAELRQSERMRVTMFWLCALGYMAPWTFIGSLIAFFKQSRDANFYVELYGIYYAMGMPTSMLQEWYDSYWDMKLGSTWTYLMRGQVNFLIITLVVLVMPSVLLDRWLMMVLMAILGVSSWMLHGTACMLASMTSTSAISALQTGFRTPEILAIIACYYLDIGSTASETAIRIFFLLIAALSASGLIAWTSLVLLPRTRATLAEKDRTLHEFDIAAEEPLLSANPQINVRGSQPKHNFFGTVSGRTSLSRSDMEIIAHKIWPCRVALFWTMFGSIFTAAFFAYADSSNGIDIEQVLYFTRLVGDLLGRPFTSLPRPRCLSTPRQVAIFAVARLVFAAVYFGYVFIPNVPQSDAFIIANIGIFSITSGYLGIICYEYVFRAEMCIFTFVRATQVRRSRL